MCSRSGSWKSSGWRANARWKKPKENLEPRRKRRSTEGHGEKLEGGQRRRGCATAFPTSRSYKYSSVALRASSFSSVVQDFDFALGGRVQAPGKSLPVSSRHAPGTNRV